MDSFRPRTFLEYIQRARQRKTLILLPALVFTAASFVAVKRLPNVYQSSTFIVVDSPQSPSTAPASIDLPRRLSTVKQQVTTRSGLVALIDKYKLYSDLRKKAPLDDVVAEMRSDIDVQVNSSRPDVTDAFSISYKARDPETAQMVTAELADQLISDNVNAITSQVSGEADVLQQRSLELAAQLHQMESKSPWLLNVREDAPLVQATGTGRNGPSPEAIRDHQLALGNLNDKQYQLQQQIADLDHRIAAQRKIVEGQKKNQLPQDNATYGALIAKRAELQGQRDNLLNNQGLTDKHPKVVALTDQIDAINGAIADLRRQQSGQVIQTPEERELASLQAQRDTLKIELEVSGRELLRQESTPPAAVSTAQAGPALPAVPRDAASARLAQDYLGLKKTYTDLTARLQSAELQKQTVGSGKVDSFRILDKANLPEVPVWPNRRLLGLLGLAIGLAIGILIFLAAEMKTFVTLQDSRDVEYYTQLPLLASIPKALTAPERKERNSRIRLRILGVTVAAVLATFALAKVLMVAHLFELIGRK